MKDGREFKNLEDLTDSEEEIHPNIDTKSFRKFIKKERSLRMEELKAKSNLTAEEDKELQNLIYQSLPIVKDVSEDTFRTVSENDMEDYSEDLSNLMNQNTFTINYFVEYLDKKTINLSHFEKLIDINIIECINTGNDEVGVLLSKIAMCTKWAREYGKKYLLRLGENEEHVNALVVDRYMQAKREIFAYQIASGKR